jgi:hypothetical protein
MRLLFTCLLQEVDPWRVFKGKCSTANAAGARGVPAIKIKAPSLRKGLGMVGPKALTDKVFRLSVEVQEERRGE